MGGTAVKSATATIIENGVGTRRQTIPVPAAIDEHTVAVSLANAILADNGWPLGVSVATLPLVTGAENAGPAVNVYAYRGTVRGVELDVVVGVRESQ